MRQCLFSKARIVSMLILGWTACGCDANKPSSTPRPIHQNQGRCGDGFINPGEVCDDGDTGDEGLGQRQSLIFLKRG